MLFRWQRRQHARAIGEEQRVTHVKENVAALGHESIIPKPRKSGASDLKFGAGFASRDEVKSKDVISNFRPARLAQEEPMALTTAVSLIAGFTRTTRAAVLVYPAVRSSAAVLVGVVAAFFYRGTLQNIYNILWAVVFGFATLNILSLTARRFEPSRRGLTFGELLAVMVVLISIFLLGWEMLTLFHVFPLHVGR
jgi:hypothetical protein